MQRHVSCCVSNEREKDVALTTEGASPRSWGACAEAERM
jgi:hypothetical protein